MTSAAGLSGRACVTRMKSGEKGKFGASVEVKVPFVKYELLSRLELELILNTIPNGTKATASGLNGCACGQASTPPTTEETRQCTGSPGTAPTRHTDANPFVDPGRAGETPPQTKTSEYSSCLPPTTS